MATHFDLQSSVIRPGLILFVCHPKSLITRNFELLDIGYQQHANRLRRLGLWYQARSQTEPQSCRTGPEPCCCHLRKSHPRI